MKKEKSLTIVYAILSILFALPSILYLTENKTVYKFEQWFKFFLNDTNRSLQTFVYILILAAITIVYVSIIKNRNKLFKNIKNVLIYVAIIGFIYIFIIPFTCSDVLYYMGVGRIDSKYGQNPYYTTINDYVQQNQDNIHELNKDTVLMQGYINDWGDSTVVYGPIWQLICKGVAHLSFGDVDIGLLIFKIVNLLVHLVNCWLIYKITGKKIFAIIYGLNPFVLIEGIMCVHNDMFVVMFTLFSFYFMKKKKMWITMVFLAFATAIKYFSILLLPFIIIYYFRKEKVSIRILNCIKYGAVFLVALLVPYLLYSQDASILLGIATQQSKIAKSIYTTIMEYFPEISTQTLGILLLEIFATIYFFTCLDMLFKKKIVFRDTIRTYKMFLLAFLFVLIKQFQPWYLMWLMPIFMWQKPNTAKLLVLMGIISEFANAVFLLKGEGYIYGTPFILVLYTTILASALILEKQFIKRKINCYTKKLVNRKV